VHYTIIDIETTGNGLKGNKITEIAIFKFDGEKVIDEFTSLVNPECPIPFFITGLTGIDDATVRDAPVFSEISEKVNEMTRDCIFVAHAVNFDYGVIKEEFRQLGLEFSRKKLCTVRLSRKLVPGLQSYSLGKLCAALNIPITDRHRARGDAEATVILFQHLLQKPDAQSVLTQFLNSRNQEATLPPLLSREKVAALPNAPGVYYFKNRVGEIIYIGKAINLKKRVLGHFYDKSNREIQLCKEVADIDHELSGSELVALLMESAAIKSHYPRYNRAQKKTIKQYAIFSYTDRKGIIHLGVELLKMVSNPLEVFQNRMAASAYLENLCEAHGLCPKYCHLQQIQGPCAHHRITDCSGICRGHETVEAYNEKVTTAMATMAQQHENFIIERKGRHAHEKAVVLVKEGMYCGYGFIDSSVQINSVTDLEAYIIPQKNSLEAQRIIAASLKKGTTPLQLASTEL